GKQSAPQRPHDAASSSRAPSVASVDPGSGHGLRPEPEDRRQVAATYHDRRRADGPADAAQRRAHGARGGGRGRVPAAHAAAPRRRAGLPAREHAGALAQRPPPLPGAPRHQPPAQGRRRRGKAGPVRRHHAGLRAHRRLRVALGRGQGAHVPRRRPGDEVHLRRAAPARHHDDRRRVLARCPGRVPVRAPHGADRQRRRVHQLRGHQVGLAGPRVRPALPRARDHAQAHPPLPPVDQRAGRADAPHGQGRHRARLPLRHACRPGGARRRLRHRLQLRQAPQGAPVANPVPGGLRRLDEGPRPLQDQPAPPHPGTVHL
ncbi:MAG: Transposase, partial [uncultured Gemmatimonadaceae bacterium]